MSTFTQPKAAIEGKFGLKRDYADLKARSMAEPLDLSMLEAVRLGGTKLTASKYGLEAICGASCETGAQ